MIPIPRTGCYWGVEDKLPQNGGYYRLNLYKVHETDVEEINIWFGSREQGIISVWLCGFSYQQVLKLFSDFENIQNLRNFIFPRCLGTCIELRVGLNEHPPRQLADSEYIAIVGEVGVPKGKIAKATYKRYMDWVQHKEQVWWINISDSKVDLDKLTEKLEKLELDIQRKTVELGKVIAKLNGIDNYQIPTENDLVKT